MHKFLIHIKQLPLNQKEGGIHILLNLTGAKVTCIDGRGERDISFRIGLVNLGFMIAYDKSSTTTTKKGDSVLLKNSKKRSLVLIVVAPNFYGMTEGRSDIKTVENDSEDYKSVRKEGYYFLVWIVKARCVIRLFEKRTNIC